jgi:hypothetical protein
MKQNDSKFSEAIFYPYSHKIIQRMGFITESTAYFFLPKYKQFPSHVKVSTMLLGLIAYRFRNWNIMWWLNVST